MNPSQIEYKPKDLVVLRASNVYVKYDSLGRTCRSYDFEMIRYDMASRCYEPNWCNHPLLVVEELEASDNHKFQGTVWNTHTYRSRFVACLNSDNDLVVLPRDNLIHARKAFKELVD